MNPSANIPHPNKTFIADFNRKYDDESSTQHFMLIAAKDEDTAKDFLIKKYGFAPELKWIPDCDYKTIRDQTGTKELTPQVKILYHTHTWVERK